MTTSATDWAGLTARAHANYLDLFRTFARLSPDGAIEEDEDLLLVRTGPLLPTFNTAHVLRPPAAFATVLERVQAFYRPHGQGWGLTTVDAVTEQCTAEADRLRLRPLFTEPGMILTPLTDAPVTTAGLEIRAAATPQDLLVYNDTMTAGFGGSPWAMPPVLETRRLLDEPGLWHFIGLLNGEPVATAMCLARDGIAGIFNVSTVPAYRRLGIGEAITRHAAIAGRDHGCTAAALQASAMGEPVYRRMGFQEMNRYTVWIPW